MLLLAKILRVAAKSAGYIVGVLAFLVFLLPTLKALIAAVVPPTSKVLFGFLFIVVPVGCVYAARTLTARPFVGALLLVASAFGIFLLGSGLHAMPIWSGGSSWDDLAFFGLGLGLAAVLLLGAVFGFIAGVIGFSTRRLAEPPGDKV